jgi:uncharacterized protein YkwD
MRWGISVAFFSKPMVIVAVSTFGVLFAVAALTKGGERRDSDATQAQDVIRESSLASEATALPSELIALRPIEAHGCSVNSIEPELKALFHLHQTARDNGARCGSTKMRSTSSLLWSCELANAADNHVSDMAKNGFMSHKGSDGSTVGQRATKANYIWRNVAENVAKGFEVPKNVHRVWLESPGHCKNIMNPIYREMGAAKVGDYWVVMFGRR